MRRGQRDDHFVHPGVPGQRRQAALEQRLAGQRPELLGHTGAGPGAEPAGGENRAHERPRHHATHRSASRPPTAAPTRAAVRSSTWCTSRAAVPTGA